MSSPYLGEIRPFAGNFAPLGWAMCTGALVPISQNSALFSLLGTTYGGDGQNTFALPDLQGRAVIHQGQGSGLQNYVMGEVLGAENVTLSSNQMPNHGHTFSANNAGGNTPTPGTSAVLAGTPSGFPIYDGTGTTTPLSSRSVSNAGGSLP